MFGMLNMVRGTACSICADPDNFANVFSGKFSDGTLKVKVKTANYQAYVDSMKAAVDCFKGEYKNFKEAARKYIKTAPDTCKA